MTFRSIGPHQTLVVRNNTTDTIDPSQSWHNDGTIDVRHGTLNLDFGTFNPSATRLVITNNGTIEAERGATVNISADANDHQASGVLANTGAIIANGGTVTLNAPIAQTGHGKIDITHGGTVSLVALEASIDGGTIAINSGMLSMGYFPSFYPDTRVHASLDFTGRSGTLEFRGLSISETFSAATNDLSVFTPSHGSSPIADFHLVGRYSAAEFSVHGSDLVFMAGH